MDKDKLLAVFRGIRSNPGIVDPQFKVESTKNVVRLLGPSNDVMCNAVLDWSCSPEKVSQLIDEEILFFSSEGRDFEWKWYDYDLPKNLPEILQDKGFVPEEIETLVAVDLNNWDSSKSVHANKSRIERVKTEDVLESVIQIQEDVWKKDFSWLRESLSRELTIQPNLISIYLAFVDGAAVSTGWTRFLGDIAWIFGGSTLEAYRRQGIYQDLLLTRMNEAKARGAKYVVTDATNRSLPVLKKYGFGEFAKTRPFTFVHR